MKTLINLFEENFRPCDDYNPCIALSEYFILNNGFTLRDIIQLINEKKIEHCDVDAYRMTSEYKKQWAGNSYKYIPEFAR